MDNKVEKTNEKKSKLVKPQKKRMVDKEEDELEDMIRSYKSSFSNGVVENASATKKSLAEGSNLDDPTKMSREKVGTKRWFE